MDKAAGKNGKCTIPRKLFEKILMQKPFQELEREHLSLVLRSSREGKPLIRERLKISISTPMLKYLENMEERPHQYSELRKIDKNINYSVKQLVKYGLARKKTKRKIGKIKTHEISIYNITEKGKKLLEVLEMPND